MTDASEWHDVSPFVDHVGLHTVSKGAGSATVGLRFSPGITNRKGNVHGGAITSLIDIAMSEAIRSGLVDFKGIATISLSVNFVSTGSGDLTGVGTLVYGGKSVAYASAEVRDKSGKVLASGQGAFRVIR